MPHATHKTPKRTADAELVEEVRRLELNRAQAFIRTRSAQAWLAENAASIDAYNRLVEAHGIWNEGERGW